MLSTLKVGSIGKRMIKLFAPARAHNRLNSPADVGTYCVADSLLIWLESWTRGDPDENPLAGFHTKTPAFMHPVALDANNLE